MIRLDGLKKNYSDFSPDMSFKIPEGGVSGLVEMLSGIPEAIICTVLLALSVIVILIMHAISVRIMERREY